MFYFVYNVKWELESDLLRFSNKLKCRFYDYKLTFYIIYVVT